MPHGLDAPQIILDIHHLGFESYETGKIANAHRDARTVWAAVHDHSSDLFVQPEAIRDELRGTRCCQEYMNGRNSDTQVQLETIHDEVYT